jgi:hypothetical protein
VDSNISFGNGAGDHVSASAFDGGSSTIIFGNRNGNVATLAGGNGGDVIITGTGLDTVTVGGHSTADTFGFVLETNGSSYTTVTGAWTGDQVAIGNLSGIVVGLTGLGNTLASERSNSSWTTLASFIQPIATPVPGHTYMGNNGTDTFIFTDTLNGHTGAIEIGGVFSGTNSTISGHVLTLQI